jgi:predicted nucleic acid-binding protein
MNIFLDANILVSVLNNEYPLFTYSARVLSLADNKKFKVFTSPLCLAIAFYFAEKKNGNASALQKIRLLASKLQITTVDNLVVKKVVAEKQVHDFEDGMEYFSAINSGCKFIITQDESDFYFSKIEVLNAQAFLEKYVL